MSESVGGSRRARILPRSVSERRGGAFAAGMLVVAGALFVWLATRLDFGNVGLPGPGFFPLFVGTMLVLLALAIGIGRWRSAEGPAIELGHRDVLIVAAALLVVPLLFEPLGAYVTLALFAAALLVLIARVPLLTSVAAAACGMTACWYFFQVLLGLSLPTGPF